MGRMLCGALLAMATVIGSPAWAQAQEGAKKKGNVTVETVYRASTIKGMGVYNLEGEKVGTLDELVIDIEKGQVVYAALSVGGFLGVGDKLFAIPWREFTLEVGEDGKFFRVDVTKEKLKKAEGFDKDAWPNVADPKWRQEIESQYRERQRDRERKTTTKTTTKETTRERD
ncbi:MAG: PRC-barrel domain-containing protein [Pirellulales bacterium]